MTFLIYVSHSYNTDLGIARAVILSRRISDLKKRIITLIKRAIKVRRDISNNRQSRMHFMGKFHVSEQHSSQIRALTLLLLIFSRFTQHFNHSKIAVVHSGGPIKWSVGALSVRVLSAGTSCNRFREHASSGHVRE